MRGLRRRARRWAWSSAAACSASEAANALKNLGLETHVVELAPRLMTLQVDDIGGAVLRRRIEALGVTVHLGALTTAHRHQRRRRRRRRWCSRTAPSCRPTWSSSPPASGRATSWRARRASDLGERGGIEIDDRCRTSDPAIFAIGECAAYNDRVYGLVAPGYHMARVAASALAGHGGETLHRLRHEHQAQAHGRRRRQLRRRVRGHARRARHQRRRHAGRGLQEAGGQPRQEAAAGRRAGRRRRQLRAARAAGAEPHPAAAAPGRSADAAARGRASRPASASTRCPTPRRSARATT